MNRSWHVVNGEWIKDLWIKTKWIGQVCLLCCESRVRSFSQQAKSSLLLTPWGISVCLPKINKGVSCTQGEQCRTELHCPFRLLGLYHLESERELGPGTTCSCALDERGRQSSLPLMRWCCELLHTTVAGETRGIPTSSMAPQGWG